jgi:hypothetical protein
MRNVATSAVLTPFDQVWSMVMSTQRLEGVSLGVNFIKFKHRGNTWFSYRILHICSTSITIVCVEIQTKELKIKLHL